MLIKIKKNVWIDPACVESVEAVTVSKDGNDEQGIRVSMNGGDFFMVLGVTSEELAVRVNRHLSVGRDTGCEQPGTARATEQMTATAISGREVLAEAAWINARRQGLDKVRESLQSFIGGIQDELAEMDED